MRRFWFLALFWVFVITNISIAAQPMERVKELTDAAIKILTDEKLKDPSKKEQRKQLLKDEINKVFDWEEFSKRSLAQHWPKLTPEQKKEFIELYQKLLESIYSDRLDEYSGEKIRYEGEEISGNNAIVKAIVTGYKGADVPLIYRLINKNNKWYVYDVVIEGVSLVNNYRSQFNSIMTKSGFNGLIKAMKEKIEGKGGELK